jgi:hypothetical protein
MTDDTIIKFTLTGNGFKNVPVPIGSTVLAIQALRVGSATLVALQHRLHDPITLICIAFCDRCPTSGVWCCRAGDAFSLPHRTQNRLKLNLIKEVAWPGMAYAL